MNAPAESIQTVYRTNDVTLTRASLREPVVMHLLAQQQSVRDHRKPLNNPVVADAVVSIVGSA